jgi:3-carboxy-cis,cis-muconate cycloisomerase
VQPSGTALYGELYGTSAMREAFSLRRRLRALLDVEVALARAEASCGVIPAPAAEAIAAAASDLDRFDLGALVAGTEHVGYPVVPLTKQLAQLAGDDAGRYVHWGATTQDVVDSATALQLREAFALLDADLGALIDELARRAREHRDDVMAGRTHLQHALPITFGYACALWLAPLPAHRARLRAAAAEAAVVQFGGAVGTLASLGARGRAVALALGHELGLRVPDVPWHVDRSAFANAVGALGLVCGSLAKFAGDVALLMQTEVGEVSEPHAPGRGGSSTMPQKRNPIAAEYAIANARAVRAQVPVMLEAMSGDHQRSTGPWQTEELALAQAFVRASAAFAQTLAIARGMTVDAARMRRNLDATGGLIVAEAVSMALAEHIGHEAAHAAVARAANEALETGRPFLDALAAMPEITRHLDRAELERRLDPARYTGEAQAVVDRVMHLVQPSGDHR